jgi:hypothetical protein
MTYRQAVDMGPTLQMHRQQHLLHQILDVALRIHGAAAQVGTHATAHQL